MTDLVELWWELTASAPTCIHPWRVIHRVRLPDCPEYFLRPGFLPDDTPDQASRETEAGAAHRRRTKGSGVELNDELDLRATFRLHNDGLQRRWIATPSARDEAELVVGPLNYFPAVANAFRNNAYAIAKLSGVSISAAAPYSWRQGESQK